MWFIQHVRLWVCVCVQFTESRLHSPAQYHTHVSHANVFVSLSRNKRNLPSRCVTTRTSTSLQEFRVFHSGCALLLLVVVVVVVVVVSLVLHLDVFRCCSSLLFFSCFLYLVRRLVFCPFLMLREALFRRKRISLILHSILIIAYGFGYSQPLRQKPKIIH